MSGLDRRLPSPDPQQIGLSRFSPRRAPSRATAAGQDSSERLTLKVAALEDELRKLRTINDVLMDRVERELDPRVDTAFSRLYQAIALETSVSKRTEALTGLTRRLMHEISERRDVEAALQAARAAAEQANLGKTAFLAAASHDLNQPLNAARLFLGALAEALPPGRERDMTGRIDSALDTMDHMLTALMDISKLDAGVLQPDVADFAFLPMQQALFHEFEPQAARLGLELRLVPTAATLRTDRHLLERILRNLIGNAIRYTREGRILFGCRHLPDGLRIDVVDTGIGIARDKWQTIFQEFHQLGGNPRSADKGVGLGLAIVERIGRLLSCPIELDSRVGRGSRFSVHVPYGVAPTQAVASSTGPAGGGTPDFGTCMVVVIDNDPQVLDGMQSLLHSWNCGVVGAVSAEAALAQSPRCPDIIIADYHLDAGTYGTDAIAALNTRFGRPVPSLIITSDKSARLRGQLRAGGHAVLAKPVAPARLRALMSHLLADALA
jgi:signal transduction histidine kinase